MAPLATAYSGPPKLTLVRAFTEWRVDVPMLVLILLLAAWYLVSVRKVRRRRPVGQRPHVRVHRARPWVLGDRGDGVARRLPGRAVLRPGHPDGAAGPRRPAVPRDGQAAHAAVGGRSQAGRRVERVIRSRAARALTFPAITTLALVAVPFVMYFTGWYAAAFRSGVIRELSYLALLASGYLYFWTFLRVDPVPRTYNRGRHDVDHRRPGRRGRVLRHRGHRRPEPSSRLHYYQAAAPPVRPGFATDQVLGGGVLWILGDFVGLPFLAVQLIHVMREDKAEAAGDRRRARRARRRPRGGPRRQRQ